VNNSIQDCFPHSCLGHREVLNPLDALIGDIRPKIRRLQPGTNTSARGRAEVPLGDAVGTRGFREAGRLNGLGDRL
jgi:hypothetical protein